MTPHAAYIALGSNLGDREATLHSALAQLQETPSVNVTRVSTIIETPPMGQPGQQPYLNAAAQLETTLAPRGLLNQFLKIEAAHGRKRDAAARWGPRELDIDLLLFADRIIDEPGLTVPHPHMHERLFVMQPLMEISPALMHPILERDIAALTRDLLAEQARAGS